MSKATPEQIKRWTEEGNKLLPRYHVTDDPCPKCGAPTLTDETDAWRVCLLYRNPQAPQYGGTCDYGTWL